MKDSEKKPRGAPAEQTGDATDARTPPARPGERPAVDPSHHRPREGAAEDHGSRGTSAQSPEEIAGNPTSR